MLRKATAVKQADESCALECRDLRKTYGPTIYALGSFEAGVSFSVRKGELFALVGPSGCGKTTTLKIVGGFSQPTGGSVTIAGRDVTNVPPFERPTNTVFQNYALFPHLTVQENIEFGLRMENIGKVERQQRAREALDAIAMISVADRRISELSGGQQQRVALARALVKRPEILLLDEPLGALDLGLRKRLQEEIVRLKISRGITMIHVTHDQEEACAIADRIAVMNRGQIVQVDRPIDLFRAPTSSFIATFISAGTVLRGAVKVSGSTAELDVGDFVVRGNSLVKGHGNRLAAVIRYDKIAVKFGKDRVGPPINQVTGIVDQIQFMGSVYQCVVKTTNGTTIRATFDAFLAPENVTENVGNKVTVSWQPEDVLFVVNDDEK